MRRPLTVLAGLALLLGLLVPPGVAGAKGDDKSHDRENEHRGSSITLYSVETSTVNISPSGEVDPPEGDPDSFGPGARFSAVDVLYRDEDRTYRVGRNDISCLFTEVTGDEETGTATLLCHGVVQLDGQGSLTWQGSITFASTDVPGEGDPFGTVAITGGTGAFRAAAGQIVLFDESLAETQTLNRYEVDLLQLVTKK